MHTKINIFHYLILKMKKFALCNQFQKIYFLLTLIKVFQQVMIMYQFLSNHKILHHPLANFLYFTVKIINTVLFSSGYNLTKQIVLFLSSFYILNYM